MDNFSKISQAIDDLKNGKMIIVVDDIHRENEGDFVSSAQFISPQLINKMITDGRGLVCTPITEEKAKQLELPLMVEQNTDAFRTAFTISIDGINTTTGISAFERSETIKLLAQPSVTASSFKRPGHIFPLVSKPGGVLQRPGHTEASLSLMKLANLEPVAVICEILNTDGTMARRPELFAYAKKQNMTIIAIAQLIEYIKEHV
jgi:3,4-dihydroxy 2-butanone 4-phosphate synthase / GTP cyclohydrolase II